MTKNEVITTMEPKKNNVPGKTEESSGFWDGIWDWFNSPAPSRKRSEIEAKAKQPAQLDKFKTREDVLNAIADQIKINLERKYRTKADDMDLFYLGMLQNNVLHGEEIKGRIGNALIPRYGSADTYGDALKAYFADGGKELDDVLENILNYIEPLIDKREGIIDPINFPEDIQKRLANFYNKVWQIYDSGKLDESGNPKEFLEDRINQFKAVMNSSDFAEFYGDPPDKWKELLTKLTGKYVPNQGEYQQQSKQEQNIAYQQYLKKLDDSEYTVSAQEPATNEDPVPNAENILGITGYQENPENQEEAVVEAPEGGKTSYTPTPTPTPTTDDVNALLSSSLTGPSYALNTMPGLTEEKYEALAKALRAYALKNGIVTDTPKDPESFKPYIPDFYV